jgi:hypothetical protein
MQFFLRTYVALSFPYVQGKNGIKNYSKLIKKKSKDLCILYTKVVFLS